MSRAVGACLFIVAALMVVGTGPATAQSDGNLASITYWTIEDGATEAFEAGLKAHNQIHADHNDPAPLLTWQVISGPRIGQYGRGSFGHSWADFDLDDEFTAADNADSAMHITPHIESAEPMIWAKMEEVSNSADGPGQIMRIIEFHVRPGHQGTFEQAVVKIHANLSKHDWPPYDWYALVDGGRTPTYAVVIPRDNWAGFAPGDVSFMEAMGEEGPAIMQALGEATESQVNWMIEARPELSYWPEPSE